MRRKRRCDDEDNSSVNYQRLIKALFVSGIGFPFGESSTE